MADLKTNVLYYGDNLDILRQGYVPEESVDLIYLDPPFNSNATYSVIFRDESGNGSDAQQIAFDDTWHWGPEAQAHYTYLTNNNYHQGRVPSTVTALIGAFHAGIRPSPMLAYLVEMAVRLVELHRVLKPTGSLYLHCDPNASHYLKLVLDAVFGPERFLSEVIWKRTNAHSSAKRYAPVHDVLLVYAGGPSPTWVGGFHRPDPSKVQHHARGVGLDGSTWRTEDLTGAGTRKGASGSPWRGFDPTLLGRHWRRLPDDLDKLDGDGLIYWPKQVGRWPKLRVFESEDDAQHGSRLQDVWTDIDAINMSAKERLTWATQKPLALLERIIEASSMPGDVLLDPFCGCGTALVAAQKLDRRWIGIDLTYLAIAVMRDRLAASFPALGPIEVIGRPTEVEGARQLLAKGGLAGQYQFQWWALDLIGATPQGGTQKKGADKGVDGVITFTGAGGKVETCIVSVKSGHVDRKMVAELKGDMGSHGAVMGLFVTLEDPTAPMRQEATEAGSYHSELSGKDYPKVQILTIKELLEEGRRPIMPLLVLAPYAKAETVKRAAEQPGLFGT